MWPFDPTAPLDDQGAMNHLVIHRELDDDLKLEASEGSSIHASEGEGRVGHHEWLSAVFTPALRQKVTGFFYNGFTAVYQSIDCRTYYLTIYLETRPS